LLTPPPKAATPLLWSRAELDGGSGSHATRTLVAWREPVPRTLRWRLALLLCRVLVAALVQATGAASVVSSLLVLGPSNSGLSLSKLSPDEPRPSKPPS